MIVYVKNKLLSWGEDSSVKDAEGNALFKVKGTWKLFSPTRKKKIYNMEKELLYVVRNKFWHFWPSVYIYQNGVKVAHLINKFSFGKRAFILKGYSDDVEIVGAGFLKGYEVKKNGQVIGTIKRDFSIIRDSFIVEGDEDNIAFLVALVIAIDNFSDKLAEN